MRKNSDVTQAYDKLRTLFKIAKTNASLIKDPIRAMLGIPLNDHLFLLGFSFAHYSDSPKTPNLNKEFSRQNWVHFLRASVLKYIHDIVWLLVVYDQDCDFIPALIVPQLSH